MSQKDYFSPDGEGTAGSSAMPDHTQPSGQVAAGSATEQTRKMEGGSSGRTSTMTMTDEEGRSALDAATEKASDVKDMATEKAGQAKDMASDYADMGKDRAAEGLETAAGQVRERFGEDGMQGQVGTRVADGLEKTATYLREHETGELWGEIETFVKDHPVQAAAGALVAGFLMGRVLR